jgi:copper(I)-binding protein
MQNMEINMNRRHLLLITAALSLSPAAALAHEFKAGDLEIEHPWSRATGQSRPAVGYLKIRNNGTAPDRLLGASTRIAEHVMLHANVIENGVAKMSPAEGIEIPAGGELVLAPKGAYHLMIMGLKQPLAEGDTFPVTLIFEHAGKVDVTFVTAAAGATDSGD